MFAGIDSFWGVLIFIVISIIASWMQKKQQQGRNEGEQPAPPPLPRRKRAPGPTPTQPAEPQPLSWEEELKRLLDGSLAEPPPPPAAPPPIIAETRRPVPPPPPPPREFTESTYEVTRSPVEVSFKPLPPLTESVHAYADASSLEQKVGQHMRDVTHHPIKLTHAQQRPVSQSRGQARALLGNRESLRTAILASVVLGPPRALADDLRS
jgi:hypothetical protein